MPRKKTEDTAIPIQMGLEQKSGHAGERREPIQCSRTTGEGTFATSLNKPSGNKTQVISRIKPMPHCRSCKRRHSTSKPRFLAPWRDPQIHIILQPLIGILIPRFQQLFIILTRLQGQWRDISHAIPSHGSIRVVSVEPDAR